MSLIKKTLLGILLVIPVHSAAEFELLSLEDFESGSMPVEATLLHGSNSMNVEVVDYASVADSSILGGGAAGELGQYGIKLTTERYKRFLAISGPVPIQRADISEGERVLVQVDIYLKGHSVSGQTMSLAAFASPSGEPLIDGQSDWANYRVGATGDNQAFYAFVDGATDNRVYLNQPIGEVINSGEGWHRFQIVFQGSKEIYCFIDGQSAIFSPVVESTFDIVYPGIFVSSQVDNPVTVYADNLSVYRSETSGSDLPSSPWLNAITDSSDDADSIVWSADKDKAFSDASSSGKPLLVMFYHPSSVGYQKMNNSIFREGSEAADTLDQFILLRMDVGDSAGQQYARELRVMRVPSLIVLDQSGSEKGRISVDTDPVWAEIGPELENALSGS